MGDTPRFKMARFHKAWATRHEVLDKLKPNFWVLLAVSLVAGILVATLPHSDEVGDWPVGVLAGAAIVCGLSAILALLVIARIKESTIGSKWGRIAALCACGLTIVWATILLPGCWYSWSSTGCYFRWCPFTFLALTACAVCPLVVAVWRMQGHWPKAWTPRAWRALIGYVFIACFAVLWVLASWYLVDARGPKSLALQIYQAALASVMLLFASGLALVQAIEASDPPLPSEAQAVGLESVLTREKDWLQTRRRALHLEAAPEADRSGPAGLVGLALSGGGIRSATLSLGFVQGMAEARVLGQTPLMQVDYLSTVSGGGWLGGALTVGTAAASADEQKKLLDEPLSSPKIWDDLATTLRSRGDYLIPGGPGLSVATIRPLLLIVLGAILNAFALVCVMLTVIAILFNSQRETGLLVRFLHWIEHHAGPFAAVFLPGAPSGQPGFDLGRDLYAVNAVGVLFLFLTAIGLGGLVATAAGSVTFSARVRAQSSYVAAAGTVPAIVLGCALLALHGRAELVYLVGLVVAAVAVLKWKPMSPSRAKTAGIVTIVAGIEGALSKIPHVEKASKDVAHWAQANLHAMLLSPLPLFSQWDKAQLIFAAAVAAVLSVLFGFVVSRNHTGLQDFWSQQIANAYFRDKSGTRGTSPASWPLAALQPILSDAPAATAKRVHARREHPSAKDIEPSNTGGPRVGAPLQIVTASVNTPGSPNDVYRKRGTARFEFTPYSIGGPLTGWVDAAAYGKHVSLSNAIAISAAAVNSQGGAAIPRVARALLSACNCGLGVWMRNPRMLGYADNLRFRRGPHFWASYTVKDLFGTNSEEDTLVFVSDGGHHDNLGITSLVERECDVVICLDAGQDQRYMCPDLARALMLLRIDDRWEADLDWRTLEQVRPTEPGSLKFPSRVSSSPVLEFELRRPADGARPERVVTVFYVKSALPEAVPVEVQRYAADHATFPHQSTTDQFFDERQFEAYRQLGRELAKCLVAKLELSSKWNDIVALQTGIQPLQSIVPPSTSASMVAQGAHPANELEKKHG